LRSSGKCSPVSWLVHRSKLKPKSISILPTSHSVVCGRAARLRPSREKIRFGASAEWRDGAQKQRPLRDGRRRANAFAALWRRFLPAIDGEPLAIAGLALIEQPDLFLATAKRIRHRIPNPFIQREADLTLPAMRPSAWPRLGDPGPPFRRLRASGRAIVEATATVPESLCIGVARLSVSDHCI
jgi:hypothetical protein